MMSFEAKPIPVESPPEMATSQVTLMLRMERESMSQMPQTNTWMTFRPITSREAAVVGSRRT